MPPRFIARFVACMLFAASLALSCAPRALAQEEEALTEDEKSDALRLFERAQDAQMEAQQEGNKEKLKVALGLYEEAIRLRPEFPEAEYQKGMALVALEREAEGEQALRRAAQLRPKWAMPLASLGILLARKQRDQEAEPLLRRALEIEIDHTEALAVLADLRTRAKDLQGALALWRRVTVGENATASHWFGRAAAELAVGNKTEAVRSVQVSLRLAPDNTQARLLRAELYLESGDAERALRDVLALEDAAKSDARLAAGAANLYARAGRTEDAQRVLDALDAEKQKHPEVEKVRESLKAGGDADGPEALAALEAQLKQEPDNARLHARRGHLLRTQDPERAAEHYRRAAELEPDNVSYATGYGAALVQARKFDEAARVLQQVVASAPQHYEARANLATALDKLNLYREALAEYEWINRARPDLPVIYFFVARMRDQLGEYPEALAAYEAFLSKADAQQHKLQIDQVNLRLPVLRNQIKRGEGAKKKRGER